jgi:hypothetical protein
MIKIWDGDPIEEILAIEKLDLVGFHLWQIVDFLTV